MRSILVSAIGIVVLVASIAREAAGQTYWHKDFGGYTIKSGNTSFLFRNDGTSATILRSGDVEFRNYSNGTTGTSIYSSQGRFDFFSSPRQGWTGSGYIPYNVPGASTYQRSYYRQPSYNTYRPPAHNYGWRSYGGWRR